MDDMNAFERQVAGRIQHLVGPPGVVDDAAIFNHVIATTQSTKWRFQSMFSATKFVVAGAIVALFGGFLLSGVLTQPSKEMVPVVGASASATAQAQPTGATTSEPEPTTTVEADDTATAHLLPGVDLVTEEVEPGVYRVLSDGAGHDLVTEPPEALIFNPDGSLVMFSMQPRNYPMMDRFYTLGVQGDQALPGAGGHYRWFDAAFDDDGNLIASAGGGLALFDGNAWVDLTWPDGRSDVSAIEIAPDGAVWVTRSERGRCGRATGTRSCGPWPRVARIEDGVWAVASMPDDGTNGRYLGSPENLAVAPDGTVWFGSNDRTGEALPKGTKRLLRFDGEQWLEPDVPLGPAVRQFGPLAVGPDGTLWVYAAEGPRCARPHGSHAIRDGAEKCGRAAEDWTDVPPHLLRLRDGEWTVFTEADGVPHLIAYSFGARLAVDGGGTLWIAFEGDPMGPRTMPPPIGPSDPPHGVLSFDGSTWRQYLKGHHINRFDVAEDGSVWATSARDCTEVPKEQCDQQTGDGLYVITPEAMAATE